MPQLMQHYFGINHLELKLGGNIPHLPALLGLIIVVHILHLSSGFVSYDNTSFIYIRLSKGV